MDRATMCGLVALLGPVCLGGPGSLHAQDPGDAFGRALQVLADSAGTPSGAVVVLLPDGSRRIEPVGGSGVGGHGATSTSAFRVASVSKVFTAAAVAVLVGQGRLDLDADLRETWPWLTDAARGQPLTLRQVLTHSSGFDDRVLGMFARDAARVEPIGRYLSSNLPPRTTTAGQSARYSNHAFSLAALEIERVTGRPFAVALDSLVLAPLGMTSSTFDQPLPEAIASKLARAYACPRADCEPEPIDYRRLPPAGGLVTTPDDAAAALAGLLGQTDGVDDEARRLLFERHWSAGPEIPGLALALQEQDLAGHRALVHAGRSSGYVSLLVLVPEAGAGLFVVTTGGSTVFGEGVLRRFVDLLPRVEQKGTTPPEVGPVPRNRRDAYAGSYLLGRAARASYESFPGRFLFSETIGFDETGLLVRREGNRLRRYGRVAGQGDVFESVDGLGVGRERLAFERGPDGRVVRLHAADEYNGARFPATYDRLPAWAGGRMINEILSWVLALPAIAMLGWALVAALRAILSRFRLRAVPARRDPVLRAALVLATLTTVLMLFFGFGFMARFNRLAMDAPQALAYGLPDALVQLLWMPWAIAATAVGLAGMTAAVLLRRGRHRTFDILVVGLVAACALLFTGLLIHFQFLPGPPFPPGIS